MYFSGRIHTVIYEDASQAFYILKMILDDDASTPADFLRSSHIYTVRGNVPGMDIKIGLWFGFEGVWKNDLKYGLQLTIKKAPVFKDGWDPDTVEQMLSGNGVASSIIKQIRLKTGDDNFISSLSNFGALKKTGLDDFNATFVLQKWKSVQAYFKTLMFLTDLGLPSGKIKQVWSHFGDAATDVLSENPWALVELDGITFQQVDEIATRLQLDLNSPNRIRGAVLFACRSQQGFSGHLFLSTGQLVARVQDFIYGVKSEDVAKAVGELHKEKKIYVDRECRPNTVAVYNINAWEMEQQSSEMLLERRSNASFKANGLKTRPYIEALASIGTKTEKLAKKKRVQLNTVVKQAVFEWGEYESLELSKAQQGGVINALKEPISILTGLPGTGKCVTPETLVSGPWGMSSFEDVVGNLDIPVGSFYGKTINLDTSNGVKEGTHIFNGGVTDVIRITTKDGYTIAGTPEHPIKIIEGGCFKWRHLKDIKEGDVPVLVRGCQSFGEDIVLPKAPEKDIGSHSWSKHCIFPIRMNKDVAYILGYFISKGSVVSESCWSITVHDVKIQEYLIKAFEKLFTYTPSKHFDKHCGGKCVGIRIGNRQILRWFRSLGVKPDLSYQKSIPFSILRSSGFSIRCFLRSLFEGDGGFIERDCTVEYGTSSYILAYQIHVILLSFGIRASFHPRKTNKHKGYRISIAGLNYSLFREKIGFHYTELPVKGSLDNTNRDSAIRTSLLVEDKFLYSPIHDITYSKSQVWDFQVPEGHEFISGGFISHNTTSLRAAVRIFQESKIPFLLCAPTGIAAKNLAALTGARAYTIHRAFAARGSSDKERESTYAGIIGAALSKVGGFDKHGEWGYGGLNTHPAEVVIVDEASMMDQHLLYRILSCTSEKCRLVFVGDAAQLPSVGPGNVLRDLINSGQFPVTNLTEIFRQKNTSDIVFAAHDIHHGIVPKCEAPSDFMLIQAGGELEVLEIIKHLAAKLYGKRKEFQILSPRHKGTVGVTNLNVHLRELLNPQKSGLQELKIGHGTIREDDRIMIVKNNYKLGVFNGDVGKVQRIDRRAKEVELKIFGTFPFIIQVPFKELSKLVRLAYACTVHKCVAGDTLLHSAEGLCRIEDWAQGVPEAHSINLKKKIAGLSHWVETDQIYKGVIEPTIKIVTRRGYSLEGSHRHPILVCTDEGKHIWKKLPDIRKGDAVVLRRGVGNQESPVSTDGFVANRGRGHIGHIPATVDGNLAWLLGVFIGDGCLTDTEDGRVEVAQKDDVEFLPRVASTSQEVFGVSPTILSSSMYFHGGLIREFLVWCGVGYDKVFTKKTPSIILKSPLSIQASFLRGLFDTCGDVSKLIHFTTISPKLAFEVQQLLLGLGIVSQRYPMIMPKNESSLPWRVEITGSEDKALFMRLIGFSIPYKQHQLEHISGTWSKSKSNVGKIPGGSYLFFDPVVDISYDTSLVYDLHVSDSTHAFIGNGFVNHNSQGLEYEYIVMPIVDGFRQQLQRNLLYTAVTRAKKNVILVGDLSALTMAVLNDKEDLRNTLLKDRLIASNSS